jgi:predicted DNA-binding transcriptional regulator AlpA
LESEQLRDGDRMKNGRFPDTIRGCQEELLTVEDVATILKVPISWVYARTRSRDGDKLPHIRLGKYIRFEECEIQRYIAHKKRRV